MTGYMKKGVTTLAAVTLAILLLAGCGGGGGSVSTPARTSDLRLNVSLPRLANSTATTEMPSYSAAIGIINYNASGVPSAPVAQTAASLVETSGHYTGSFLLKNIPVGSNYIAKVAVSYSYSGESSYSSGRQAATTNTMAYVGALIDEIEDGVTATATITPDTTIKALAVLRYAINQKVALNNTTVISDELKDSISTAVDALIDDGMVNTQDFINAYNDALLIDPFDPTQWTDSITDGLDQILAYAELIDLTGPTVVSLYPAAGATDVPYDEAYFVVEFSETMDTTVNMNATTTLSASGFSITIAKSGGGTLTINSSNALNYGTFEWIDYNEGTDNALKFTLLPNATLSENQLRTLEPSTVYNITSRTIPSGLTDADGNELDETGIATTGSFTTADEVDTTGPTVTAFYPAADATNVPYDETVFKVIFSETMDTTVNMNATTTLSASGFSITIAKSGGGTLTINSTNALNYGVFAWVSYNGGTNNALQFTLLPNTTLVDNKLKTLQPSTTYSITSRTVPTGLKDAAGNALVTTGIASTGSFTTAAATPVAPTVIGFYPEDTGTGAVDVPYDAPQFKVIFSETMDSTINMNNSTTLAASGFSITIAKSGGSTLTIDSSNALSYGTFSWTTTSVSNDTLTFTMSSNSVLTTNELQTLAACSYYNITSRTVPTNLTDAGGSALVTSGIASTGMFSTVCTTP